MTHDVFNVFDTTLHDGARREGINLTVTDKMTIVEAPEWLRRGLRRGRPVRRQPA